MFFELLGSFLVWHLSRMPREEVISELERMAVALREGL